MRIWSSLLIATPVALGLLAAPAAHADWRHHGGGWGGYQRHQDRGHGDAVAGALIGLGVGALIGGIIASQQPQPYYAPPPVAYASPPPYYAAPAYSVPPYPVPLGY
jgi:hypothetical protein